MPAAAFSLATSWVALVAIEISVASNQPIVQPTTALRIRATLPWKAGQSHVPRATKLLDRVTTSSTVIPADRPGFARGARAGIQ